MRTVNISAGHSNKKGVDRGAAGNGLIEGEEAVRMRDRIVTLLKVVYGITPVIDNNDSVLSQSIAFFKKLVNGSSILLDIHFNAGPPTATGVETLVPRDATQFELALARDLSVGVADVLGIPLRGNFRNIKGVRSEAESQHKSLGWMRLPGQNVLLEVCFISSKKDTDSYLENFEEVCSTIARVLAEFANKNDLVITDEKIVVPTQPTSQSTVQIYTVVKGDSLWRVAEKHKTTVAKITELNDLKGSTINVGQQLRVK